MLVDLFEAHVRHMLTKLDITDSREDHRRVLAHLSADAALSRTASQAVRGRPEGGEASAGEYGVVPIPPPDPAAPRHTAGPELTRAELRILRPDLLRAYDAALPTARAVILARVLHALRHEPFPGVTRRGDRIGLPDGRTLTAPATGQFATPGPGVTAHLAPGGAYDDPATLLRSLDLGPHTARFATEVDNSVANLALAYADPPPATEPLPGTAGDPDGLGRREQAVRDGHPLHPCCRTRGGMTVADVLAYAPEHRPVIRLRRLAVPLARWYGDTPPVLYAHPWQADRLRDRYPWLTDAGETAPVRPLMSLRTVAPLTGGDHLKTAVDLQLTSAVRTVSPAAVHNGPRLSALLARLTADLPLTVLRETAAGAVLIDGTPQRHLAYLRREGPRVGPAETVLPLGALAPLLPGIATDPYAWWHDLAQLLFPPLLTVLDRGVALEAHGQNTLLVLDGTRPARIVYRDLGGVRVSARRLRAAGVEAPPVEGDLPTDDPGALRTKLAAALLGTVAAQLIAALAGAGADPGRLWTSVAAAIRGTGTADAARLLSDPLPVKATSAMRLADDPLADLWTHLDNPMAGA